MSPSPLIHSAMNHLPLGYLPDNLENLSHLTSLRLDQNHLEGSSSLRLFGRVFRLYAGELSPSLLKCSMLTYINLSNNDLEGIVLPSFRIFRGYV